MLIITLTLLLREIFIDGRSQCNHDDHGKDKSVLHGKHLRIWLVLAAKCRKSVTDIYHFSPILYIHIFLKHILIYKHSVILLNSRKCNCILLNCLLKELIARVSFGLNKNRICPYLRRLLL